MNFRRLNIFIFISLLLMSFVNSDCMQKGAVSNQRTRRREMTKRFLTKVVTGEFDINTRNTSGQTALTIAVSGGNIPLVLELLNKRADTTLKTNKGSTAIEIARRRKNNDLIDILTAYESYLDADYAVLDSIIIDEVNIGNLNVTKVLLILGADINATDDDGNSLLMIAIKRDCDSVIAELLKNGADINLANNEKFTPLMFAVMGNKEDLVKELLLKGAERDVVSVSGTTAMDLATLEENIMLRKLLSLRGGQRQARDRRTSVVSARSTQGRSAGFDLRKSNINSSLINAVKEQDTVSVRSLLGEGADVNSTDERGLSLLMLAVKYGNERIVSLLLANGADVNTMTQNGRSALVYAVQSGNESIFLKLLEKGADPYISFFVGGSNSEKKLIDLAMKYERERVAQLLTILSMYKPSPAIVCMVKGGDLGAVRGLLEVGSDVNTKSHDGLTLLMIALAESRFEVAEFLIENGVDLSIKVGVNSWTAKNFAENLLEGADLDEAFVNKVNNIIRLINEKTGIDNSGLIAEQQKSTAQQAKERQEEKRRIQDDATAKKMRETRKRFARKKAEQEEARKKAAENTGKKRFWRRRKK